ncbi:hypothetical protein FRB94_001337 [Tulasnella sp. JGI-2019a]|nr:hypothetical protein FRB94_001337 [Tulasnella sp. JGI-2019a]
MRSNGHELFPDGTTIVSGSYDKTLRLWDAKTGEAIGEAMKGHTDWVNCVAISPDGTTIVSGSDDRTLQLWDAKIGEGVGKAMEGHTQPVSSIDFSLGGKYILSVSQGSFENLVWSWENQTQLLDMQFQQGMTILTSLYQVSKDG